MENLKITKLQKKEMASICGGQSTHSGERCGCGCSCVCTSINCEVITLSADFGPSNGVFQRNEQKRSASANYFNSLNDTIRINDTINSASINLDFNLNDLFK